MSRTRRCHSAVVEYSFYAEHRSKACGLAQQIRALANRHLQSAFCSQYN
jgi:hypothetical protein